MNNSIQYFVENGIPELEKVKNIMLDFGCHIVSGLLEECNTLTKEHVQEKKYQEKQ